MADSGALADDDSVRPSAPSPLLALRATHPRYPAGMESTTCHEVTDAPQPGDTRLGIATSC
ncbi:MAG: hypothetical protein ACRDQ5_02890, partial [Sciscionella sp.]